MKIIFKGEKIKVRAFEVPTNGGGRVSYEMVDHPGAVVILPFLDSETLVLIKQRRYGIDLDLWELPAGTIEGSEIIEICAKRELEEETGYIARSLEPLTAFYSSPGYSNEFLHIFLATDLTLSQQRLDDTEVIETHPMPLERAIEMIQSGEIKDGKTIASLLYYWSFRT